jgi:hypothetical protein
MGVKYIPNGNVKIVVKKVSYQNKDGKNAVLPAEAIGKEELEGLLKRGLVRKLELDEETGGMKKDAGGKNRTPEDKNPKDGVTKDNEESKPPRK